MKNTLEYLNKRASLDPEVFLAECDLEYANRITEAADKIEANLKINPIVLLSGPSGSGKTTSAKKIEDELEKRGINSHTVSMDNYFKTLNPQTCPRTPEGEIDFESPLLLDMDLLNEHFDALARGEEIKIPYFMFTRQKRSSSQFTPMRLEENEIVIFEGIHALNDAITARHPEAFKLFISVATPLDFNGTRFRREWIRLLRRTVRDNNFRGSDAAFTFTQWPNVMAGEAAHITPFKHKADFVFDTSLFYELSVLKNYALPLLENMPRDASPDLDAIITALDMLIPIDPELVSEDSLLREFIGGGKYEY